MSVCSKLIKGVFDVTDSSIRLKVYALLSLHVASHVRDYKSQQERRTSKSIPSTS